MRHKWTIRYEVTAYGARQSREQIIFTDDHLLSLVASYFQVICNCCHGFTAESNVRVLSVQYIGEI